MDISIMNNDKNNQEDCRPYYDRSNKYEVHKLPEKFSNAGKDYGLFIFHFGRGGKCPPPPKMKERYFEFYNISHMFDGHGFYWTPQGGKQEVKAGQCVIVSPGFIHSYGGSNDFYVEDAICFYGPLADYLFKNKIIQNGIFERGKTRKLLPIIELAIDPAFKSQLQASVALQQLLIEIHSENKSLQKKGKYTEINDLVQLLKDNTSKWWTIEEMAEFCNLSEPQFRKVFKAVIGMSPKNYIDKLKIQQAAEMLSSGKMKINDLSKKLGYMDPFHFSRRFKELTGMSPEKYRENMNRDQH